MRVVTDQHLENNFRSRQLGYQQRKTIFIKFDCDCVTRDKNYREFYRGYIISRSFVVWAQTSVNKLLLPGKSKSSIFNFCRSFLTCQTCW